MHFSIDRTVHTTAFDKPVVDHWLERKIAQTAAGSTEKVIRVNAPGTNACYLHGGSKTHLHGEASPCGVMGC